MAVAKTKEGTLTILGAPRYQHRGVVMTVLQNGNHKKIDPFPWQVRAYNKEGLTVLKDNVNVLT